MGPVMASPLRGGGTTFGRSLLYRLEPRGAGCTKNSCGSICGWGGEGGNSCLSARGSLAAGEQRRFDCGGGPKSQDSLKEPSTSRKALVHDGNLPADAADDCSCLPLGPADRYCSGSFITLPYYYHHCRLPALLLSCPPLGPSALAGITGALPSPTPTQPPHTRVARTHAVPRLGSPVGGFPAPAPPYVLQRTHTHLQLTLNPQLVALSANRPWLSSPRCLTPILLPKSV